MLIREIEAWVAANENRITGDYAHYDLTLSMMQLQVQLAIVRRLDAIEASNQEILEKMT